MSGSSALTEILYRLLYIHYLVAQKQVTSLCIIFSKEVAELRPFMLSLLTCLITESPKKVNMEKTCWILISVSDLAENSRFQQDKELCKTKSFSFGISGLLWSVAVGFFTVSRSRLPEDNHGFASYFSVIGI